MSENNARNDLTLPLARVTVLHCAHRACPRRGARMRDRARPVSNDDKCLAIRALPPAVVSMLDTFLQLLAGKSPTGMLQIAEIGPSGMQSLP